MKKSILALLVLSGLCFAACDKDADQQSAEELFEVKFSTRLLFDPDDEPLSKLKRTALNDPDSSIYEPGGYDTCKYDSTRLDSVYYRYLVYNSTGNPVKQMSGTGYEISDHLPAGNYKIAIIGSYDRTLISNEYDIKARGFYTDSISYPKAFYHSFDFLVDPNEDVRDTLGISLKRMWGEMSLEIIDKATCYLPSATQSVNIRIEGYSPYLRINNQQGLFAYGVNQNTPLSVPAFRNKTLIDCLVSYSTEGNVNIYLETLSNGKVSKSVLLTSAKVKKGYKTTLKGSLGNTLNEDNQQGLKFEIEESWNTEIIGF